MYRSPQFSRPAGTPLCPTLLMLAHLFHWMGGSWVSSSSYRSFYLLVCYTHTQCIYIFMFRAEVHVQYSTVQYSTVQ